MRPRHFFTRLTLPTLEFGITDKSECLCVFMLGSTWKCVLFQPSLVRAFLSSLKLQTVCSTWEAALGSLADWLQCINMEGKRVMRNLEPSGITKIQSHLFPSQHRRVTMAPISNPCGHRFLSYHFISFSCDPHLITRSLRLQSLISRVREG